MKKEVTEEEENKKTKIEENIFDKIEKKKLR